MLKKRTKVSHAPIRVRLTCSRFDIEKSKLPEPWGISGDRDAAGQFCAQLRQRFSSVEKHADRRISSLSKRR
jgi:hypothetical protein